MDRKEMKMVDLLIRGGLVLTLEPNTLQGPVYPDGAVAVEGNRIVAVGPTAEVEGAFPEAREVIDARGRIVMPGFVCTHTHMPYVLGHNMPVDFSQLHSFWDMLQKMGWEWLEDLTTSQGVYAATRYAAAKMLKSGTTTVCELVEAPIALGTSPSPLQCSAQAVEEIGIRAQIGFEVTERVLGVPILERLERVNAEKGFIENLAFLEKHPPRNGSRVEGRLGVHTAFTNSYQTLRQAREIADAFGCGIEIHVAEIPRAFLVEKFGKSAPEVLEETGLLGPDVIAAHCIDLTDGDMEILHRNRVNVSHTPMSNSAGGNGVARIPRMLELGINVTLGHDCFFTLDYSQYLRYMYLLHKAHNANPMLIPPFQALDIATGNGARAMGLGDEIGSLKIGKKADLIVIRPDSPTPTTPESVLSFFTMTFEGRQVEHVIVDGRVVVKSGHLTTGNEDEIHQACLQEAKLLWQRNGISV
jgi:cytosine/adenosine deaminase-related metal-dependent hydrolase